PHPGEAARLLEEAVPAVTGDPIAAAARLTARHGATVVLKGGPSVTAAPGALPVVNPTGNPGMAAGGMGDVLSGLTAALLAGRFPTAGGAPLAPFEAACLAVALHGLAGDLLAAETGPLLNASALAARLPEAMRRLAQGGPLPGGPFTDRRFAALA
ncbi:MAG TPA: NAD(P)H-hydrate dehydratase, partial [Deinococcales bacterium]|nr:NAD(P)H-hydrate dehydratase [Deinococcales bacterium]